MKKLTPLKAIRAECLDCSGNSPKVVRFCHITDCPLYPFRTGHNLKRKGVGNSNAVGLKRTISKSKVEVNNAERV